MGRAYEVRKASIQKTGAAKAKLYSTFAKEIYLAAKKGGNNPEANPNLKHLVDKAKKQQVPLDIINRALTKAEGNAPDDYIKVVYEGFGPGASTLLIECLTDNVNRTVSMVRTAFNKIHKNLGVTNSVAYDYDYLGVIAFKTTEAEALFEHLLQKGIELVDLETEADLVTIKMKPGDYSKVKAAIIEIMPEPEYEFDEIGMVAHHKVALNDAEREDFEKLINLLESNEDVVHIYHNVRQ